MRGRGTEREESAQGGREEGAVGAGRKGSKERGRVEKRRGRERRGQQTVSLLTIIRSCRLGAMPTRRLLAATHRANIAQLWCLLCVASALRLG